MVGRKIKHLLRSKEMLLFLIVLVVIIIFRTVNRHFLSVGSLSGIMQDMSIAGIFTIAMGVVIIGGGIDLSVTRVALFAGVLAAILMRAGVPWFWAMIVTLVAGGIVGFINSLLISKLRIMPFMATVAVLSVLEGFNLYLTNAQNIPIRDEGFWWGGRTLFSLFPYSFIVMTVLMIIYGLILTKTQFGRNVYLVGGNMAAARLTGVNPVWVRMILYINSGMLSAFAGIVNASRMKTANPQAIPDYMVTSLTASVLGGVAFTGGAGGMGGCFIGVMLLSFFTQGLTSLALPAYWTYISTGILLIVALTVDYFNERAREKRLRARPQAIPAANKEGAQ